jgi:23S rRNA (pseudouridine1915-N3)-methyltransferase
MRIHLIAVGRRMPPWVEAGYTEYARRLPPECALSLVEIDPGPRGKSSRADRAREEEGRRLLKAVPKGARVVVLDAAGSQWGTEALSDRLNVWRAGGQDLALLVGGPDGLAQGCLARADERWSLSRLTFPHPLVRILVAEQLYRAWTLIRGHPYHRGGDA